MDENVWCAIFKIKSLDSSVKLYHRLSEFQKIRLEIFFLSWLGPHGPSEEKFGKRNLWTENANWFLFSKSPYLKNWFFKKRTVNVTTGIELHLTKVVKPLSSSNQIQSVLLRPKNTAEYVITFEILAIPLKNFSWNQGGEIW